MASPTRWPPPVGAPAMAGWALLPLRAFLGVTFCFAGLQKLANPEFFDPNNPSGIQAQLVASERISPLHALLGHLVPFATPIGVLIALGELAVGVGALLGLWTRLAALGGMALSLTLFLTVSVHASPYYTGADIVFLFAWTPLVVAGSGGVLSLDQAPLRVPVRFTVVPSVCGQYEDGRCAARGGAACGPEACPFLLQRPRRTAATRARSYAARRRSVVLGGLVAAGAAVLAGLTAGLGRLAGGAAPPAGGGTSTLHAAAPPSSTTTTPTTAAGGATPTTAVPTTIPGVAIGPAGGVPVGGAARFTDPASGDPALVLQLARGSFVAYDAVCPHAGCTVGYSSAARLIVCPCHGSEFNPATGAVEVGPASRGLGTIPVAEGGDGQLYVDG